MLIFGHRGARGLAPENTMTAFQIALQLGVDGIELDVHMTKDGKIVVCHDHYLERTSNGKGWIPEHTRDELQDLDFGSWFGPEFAGEKIPSLREVLQWAAATKLIVNVEIKNGPIIYEGIEEKVAALIRECRMTERVIVSSFYHPSLLRMKQLDPMIKTGLLYASRPLDPWLQLRVTDTDNIHPQWHYLDSGWALGTRPHAAKIHAWTINEMREWEHISHLGVDGIMTDFPDRFVGKI